MSSLPASRRTKVRGVLAFALASLLIAAQAAQACTRLVYHGYDGHVITARSMDWKSDITTNLWVLPRGMSRNGLAGPNSIAWTSKYGSVVASGYDISTTDGVNEAGLNANLLWLARIFRQQVDGRVFQSSSTC